MSDKREERRKRDKQLFTGLICLFALMLLCVFAITVKTAVKNSRKHAQAEEASAKQAPEPERESEQDILKDFVLEIPTEEEIESREPETETETETEQETETETETETDSEEEAAEKAADKKSGKVPETVEEMLAEMTVEEKAAQLFMVTPEALTESGRVTAAGEATEKALEKYPVGGLVYFSENFVNPEQTREMTKNVQGYAKEISGVPLFLATDEEGGRVARIGENSAFGVEHVKDMASIGETGDVKEAYQAGKTIGKYLWDLGINVDFAPVADVLTNPENTVIGSRSFGSRPEQVALMDLSVMEGLKDENVLPCVKHFPGHGSSVGDTHSGYVSLDKTLEELTATELLPFQSCIDSNVPFVMVSHIALPKVTDSEVPASLSKKVITEILRGEMGYQGIVITDAMNMGAVTSRYDSAKAAVMAIQAGADMVLMPENFSEAYQGVLTALEEGTLEEARVDEAVTRILNVKYKIGI